MHAPLEAIDIFSSYVNRELGENATKSTGKHAMALSDVMKKKNKKENRV